MRTILLLVLVLPCIVVADIRCPGGVICPSSQKCCKVNGQYECCDLNVDVPVKEENVYSGMRLEPLLSSSCANASGAVTQNGMYDRCSLMTCPGACCSEYNCCPNQNGRCCSSDRCCEFLSPCCGDGCCSAMSECCDNKGCCGFSQRCCKGWCCKKTQRCGSSDFTCINAAGVFTPAFTSVLILVAASFVSKSYFL
ncbi:uncharacterized protein NPIL_146151 [Nephila pilipes]|uniref:Uncharacterized protein n=1 Tax=Nephila pilipes TaxID=299642 RepID=A0A8X6NJ68_NEPPI|nr:uncharacterized protein NPIL_146151 [Nephila pilipes]